jgi:hypothetical protein
MKILPIVYLPFCVILSAAAVYTFVPVQGGCGKAISISNVKHLATGAMIYSSDYDDKLFPAASWFDAEMPYLKNELISYDIDLKGGQKYGLAFYKPLGLTAPEDLKNPADIPFFFPSDILARNAASGLGTLPPKPRGERGYPVSFADCHSEYKPQIWASAPISIRWKKP